MADREDSGGAYDADEPTDFAPSPPPPRSDPGIFGEDDTTYEEPAPPATVGAGGLEVSSAAVLVPAVLLLPVAFVIMYPLFRLVEWKVDVPPYPVCFAGYVAIGFVTFVKPVQKLLLALMFGARDPTPAELHGLQPAWESVLHQGFIAEEEYDLVVVDSHELNSPATGGSIVVVTTGAIEELPPDELQAILAHELGHHFGLQDIVLPLAHWLVMPVAWLGAIGGKISQFGCMIALVAAAAVLVGVESLGAEAAQVFLFAGVVFFAIGRYPGLLGGLVGRYSEYSADRAAVDLGYGSPLATAVGRYARLGPQDTEKTVGADIFGSGTSMLRRVGRINARIARQTRGE